MPNNLEDICICLLMQIVSEPYTGSVTMLQQTLLLQAKIVFCISTLKVALAPQLTFEVCRDKSSKSQSAGA